MSKQLVVVVRGVKNMCHMRAWDILVCFRANNKKKLPSQNVLFKILAVLDVVVSTFKL